MLSSMCLYPAWSAAHSSHSCGCPARLHSSLHTPSRSARVSSRDSANCAASSLAADSSLAARRQAVGWGVSLWVCRAQVRLLHADRPTWREAGNELLTRRNWPYVQHTVAAPALAVRPKCSAPCVPACCRVVQSRASDAARRADTCCSSACAYASSACWYDADMCVCQDVCVSMCVCSWDTWSSSSFSGRGLHLLCSSSAHSHLQHACHLLVRHVCKEEVALPLCCSRAGGGSKTAVAVHITAEAVHCIIEAGIRAAGQHELVVLLLLLWRHEVVVAQLGGQEAEHGRRLQPCDCAGRQLAPVPHGAQELQEVALVNGGLLALDGGTASSRTTTPTVLGRHEAQAGNSSWMLAAAAVCCWHCCCCVMSADLIPSERKTLNVCAVKGDCEASAFVGSCQKFER